MNIINLFPNLKGELTFNTGVGVSRRLAFITVARRGFSDTLQHRDSQLLLRSVSQGFTSLKGAGISSVD